MHARHMANHAGKIDEMIMFPSISVGRRSHIAQSGHVSAKKPPISKAPRTNRLRGLASRLCQRGKLPVYNASKIPPTSSIGLISFIASIPRLTNNMGKATT